MPIAFTLKDITARKASFSSVKLSPNAINAAVLSNPLAEFKTTSSTVVDAALCLVQIKEGKKLILN